MAKGDILKPETREYHDPQTHRLIRQITSHDSIHHHPFYYVPAYDDAMRWLFFVSYRTGQPQFYAQQRQTGELLQLTDRDDLHEWSLHPAHDGTSLYFTTTTGGWRLQMDSLEEHQLVDFAGAEKSSGMVGAGMGTTSLSHDDRFWAIPVRRQDQGQLLVVDTTSGQAEVICENESVGHPQFHPEDSTLLRYGGPYDNRLWVLNRDGSDHRLIYQRDVTAKEWIVHECWRPTDPAGGRREILTTNWPQGVMAIDIDSLAVRWITRFNAWHPMVDPAGQYMVTDTKHPDIGLQRFLIDDESSEPELLCASNSSNVGNHWTRGHCPYDDGPVHVYAPQHTHPHPSFSPDGTRLLFTSDQSGVAQLYEVQLTELQ